MSIVHLTLPQCPDAATATDADVPSLVQVDPSGFEALCASVVACLHVGSSALERLDDIHVKGNTAVGVHSQQLQRRPLEAALVPAEGQQLQGLMSHVTAELV